MSERPELGALLGGADVSTFFGLPECEDLDALDARIALIGAPGCTPYETVGAYCREAPGELRRVAGTMAANFARHNFDIGGPIFPDGRLIAADCGDLPFDETDFAANRATIRDAIATILDKDAVPILVGGDDSVPIPMLQAFEGRGPLAILQIDAHIDWRDEHLGERMGLSSTMRRASEMEQFDRIVHVGARGMGSAWGSDVDDAMGWGAEIVTAETLHDLGPAAALSMIPEGAEIVIALDVDALDPSIVPGVVARTPGGLDYFQALSLVRGAAQRGRIRAINVVEYLPAADIDALGALTVTRLMAAMVGILARQAA